MKKLCLSIFLVSLFAVPAAFPQHGAGAPPDPSKFVARRVQHLTTLLDLTPDQVSAATTAFTNAANSNAGLISQLHAAHRTLRADIEGGTGNIQADSNAIASLEAQIRTNDASAEKGFFATLNSDQQTKYKAMGDRRGFGPGLGGTGGFR
jgi:hypothetical protein